MKNIILLLFPFIIGFTALYSAKDITITGKVTDASGNPVSASVHAGKVYEVTDAKGDYSITIREREEYLTFSAIGFREQKVKVNGQKVIDVRMTRGNESLPEVVIPGKNSTRRNKVIAFESPAPVPNGIVGGIAIAPHPASPGYWDKTNYNTEDYDHIVENGFKKVADYPLSTFSIDVDAASYSNVRRFLQNNQLPPSGAVRTEEMINYFTYQYPQPVGEDPFSINTGLSDCPWNPQHKLLLIGLQGKRISAENLPPSNFVFLVDVSGSMNTPDKLPLVKASLKMLMDQLREEDRISMVVYAGRAGLVLPSTNGSEKMKIKSAIDGLDAGGSTAGGAGIQLAYKIAQQNFMEKGNNRVILCTDGDFNVGVSSDDALVRLIEREREKGIFLTVLGYGTGNYKDNKMQQLADKGNGNHAYIDGLGEAKKVLVNEFGGTLFTIAKDVKLQIEFNPAKVAGYRLIGYENRMLNKEDFNDDKKDAGELGSGHTVTALYEIIPAGVASPFLKSVDSLKYRRINKEDVAVSENEWATIKFRYKKPDSDKSRLMVQVVKDKPASFDEASENLRFSASVAGFAMLLRDSQYKGRATFSGIISIAESSLGKDEEGYRKEFVGLVKKASVLKDNVVKVEDDREGWLK